MCGTTAEPRLEPKVVKKDKDVQVNVALHRQLREARDEKEEMQKKLNYVQRRLPLEKAAACHRCCLELIYPHILSGFRPIRFFRIEFQIQILFHNQIGFRIPIHLDIQDRRSDPIRPTDPLVKLSF
jgi:hypothetical protein